MSDFHTASTLILEEVADFFDSSWAQADVDLLEGTLTITLPGKVQYVIHKHGITYQIWVASPFTGAHHFGLKEGQWRCTRTGVLLQEFFRTEHKAYAA